MKSLRRILEDAVLEGFRNALAPLDPRSSDPGRGSGPEIGRPGRTDPGLGDPTTTLP